MEFILSVLTVLFVGLILATALTFGFVLIAWLVGVAIVVTAFILLREQWRRWRFIHDSNRPPPNVIDGEFKDISNKDK